MPDVTVVLGALAAVLVAAWLLRRLARRLVRILLLVALIGGAVWLWTGTDLPGSLQGFAIPRE